MLATQFKTCTITLSVCVLLVTSAVIAANTLSPLEPPIIELNQGRDKTFSITLENSGDIETLRLLPSGPYLLNSQHIDEQATLFRHAQANFAISDRTLLKIDRDKITPVYHAASPIKQIVNVYDDQFILLLENGQLLRGTSKQPDQFLPLEHELQNISRIAAEQNRLYLVSHDRRLSVFDISEEGTLTLIKRSAWAFPEHPIAVHQHAIFVVRGEEGLYIYRFDDTTQSPYLHQHLHPTTGVYDIAFNENKLITASTSGLTLYSLEDTKFVWQSSLHGVGLVSTPTFINSHQLLAHRDETLYVVDIQNPEWPAVISKYLFDTPIKQSIPANRATLAYVLNQNTLHTLNIKPQTPANSNNLLDVGQGVNFGGQRRGYIDDREILYVADWFSGVHLYDIRQSEGYDKNPVLLASYHTPGSPKGVVVRDDIAYVADDDHGLQILDVSDPKQPRLIAHLRTPGLAYTPRLVGDLLYLASHFGGFQIIDVRDPKQPRVVFHHDTEGKSWSIAIKDNVAYVADDHTGLLVFDVSAIDHVHQLAQFTPGGQAEDVLLHGNTAFVAFFDDGVYQLDVSNPSEPKVLQHFSTPGNARSLDLVDDVLYVADWRAGIHLYHVGDPGDAQYLSSYDSSGAAWGINVGYRHAYILDWWGGIATIDVSDLLMPVQTARYNGTSPVVQSHFRDHFLFALTASGRLDVYDINNNLNPTWVTSVELEGEGHDSFLNGDRLYVASGQGGIHIIDTANPFESRLLTQQSNSDTALSLASDGQTLFALYKQRGIVSYAIDAETGLLSEQSQLHVHGHKLYIHHDELFLLQNEKLISINLDNNHLNVNGQYQFDHAIQALDLHHRIGFVALANGEIAIVSTNGGSVRHISNIPVDDVVIDLAFKNRHLYVITRRGQLNIYRFEGADDHELVSSQAFHHPLKHLLVHRDGSIYLSGDTKPIAVEPIQASLNFNIQDNTITATLPDSVSPGSYGLLSIDKNGEENYIPYALELKEPVFSKPKISLDDIKKAMEKFKLKH